MMNVSSTSGRLLLTAVLCLASEEVSRAESSVLATVGGVPTTDAEIERALTLPLYELEMEKHRLIRRRLDQMIVERLLARAAAARGLTVSAYVTEEIKGQLATIPPGEGEARSELVRERAGRAVHELVERLSREVQVSVSLRPPDPPVLAVSVGDDPAWGPSTAPVTVIEFADFECPVCKENLPVLQQLRALYQDHVRFVFRDFPLTSHAQARPAAEAAHCAHEQGRFWAYHDALFAQAPDLMSADYVALAERLHLRRDEFTACLGSDRPKAAVAKDLAEAQSLGLSGTPTFFINGRYVAGYQTLDALRDHIDRALTAARNGAPQRGPAQETSPR